MKMMIGENCLRTMRVVADVVPHTHDASDINSGILPIARGGTGAGTVAAALANLGICATGDIGNLHVWKKTVETSSPIAATFRLEDYTVDRSNCGGNTVPNALLFMGYGSGYIDVASSITVNDSGGVTLSNPTRYTAGGGETNLPNIILGKYIKIYFSANGPVNLDQSLTYFVPSSSSTGWNGSGSNWIYSTKLQKVVGIPYQPAGTTVTYPVSTNRNAYQEGSDAKPAGYTLGDVETGKFVLGTGVGSNAQNMFYISSSVTVDDSGNISQENQGSTYINGESGNTMQGQANNVIGKFVVLNSKQSNSDFDVGTIWYIPPDVTIRNSYSTDGEAYDQYNIINYVTKRQRVTGYAAIPANTTIEYLGALGEKTIIEMGSYVGTGTYGLNNKNKIQFKKSPKLLIVQNIGNTPRVFITLYGGKTVSPTGSGTSSSGQLYITWSDTSVSWYAGTAITQLNDSGQTYNYLLVY